MRQAEILDRVRKQATHAVVEIDRVTDEEIRADALAWSLERMESAKHYHKDGSECYIPPTGSVSCRRPMLQEVEERDEEHRKCVVCSPIFEQWDYLSGASHARWPVARSRHDLVDLFLPEFTDDRFEAVYRR